MRRALVAIWVLAGCVGTSTDVPVTFQDLEADDGIRLTSGLNGNGVNLGNGVNAANGIDLGNSATLPGGITGPYFAPPAGSDLERWIDVEPTMRIRILRYLIECALPAGVRVQLRYRGTLTELGFGVGGLGSSLAQGQMPEAEQEAVSACLLARVSTSGVVELAMFGPFPGFSARTATDASFTRREGIFFGNLFTTTAHAYISQAHPPIELVIDGSPDETLRAWDAAQSNYGIMQYAVSYDGFELFPPCNWVSYQPVETWTCDPSLLCSFSAQAISCPAAGAPPSHWYRAIEVFMEPLADGMSCRYDSDCLSGTCRQATPTGPLVCGARLPNGSFCTASSQCANNSCVMDICQPPLGSGAACEYNSDCASHKCTYNKRKKASFCQ